MLPRSIKPACVTMSVTLMSMSFYAVAARVSSIAGIEDVVQFQIDVLHIILICRTKREFRKSTGKVCSRGVFDVFGCYSKCKPGQTATPGICWNNEEMKNIGKQALTVLLTETQMTMTQTCYNFISPYIGAVASGLFENVDFEPFLNCAWTLIKTMEALDDTWDMDNGITVALTQSASVTSGIQGVSGYIGVAFEFKDRDEVTIWEFAGGCKDNSFQGTLPGLGIQGALVLYRNVEDIDGFAQYHGAGVSVFGALGFMNVYSYGSDCRINSISATNGIDTSKINASPISATFASGACITFDRTFLRTYKSPASNNRRGANPSAAYSTGLKRSGYPGAYDAVSVFSPDENGESVLNVLTKDTNPSAHAPALITRVSNFPWRGGARYCCNARIVDGWNGNYNGVCWGHQTEEDCNGNSSECYWDPANCRRELRCSLRDSECESNDDCCSGRCKVDDNLCR